MFPDWTWIIGFWLGATIGSFLNVVIYRMPRGIPIYKPTYSYCPSCDKQLTPGELVPLLSWAFQKGRCKCGKNKIGPRYFIVELITGILFAAIWYQQLVLSPAGPYDAVNVIYGVGYMLFAAALVAAIATDLAHYIIPDQINAFMLFVGLGMNVALIAVGAPEAWMWGIPSSIAGALVGIAVLWGIAFFGRLAFGKDAMGHGDIKMARGIGAVILPLGAGISFALAVAFGAVLGMAMILFRKKSTVPLEDDDTPYVPESLGSLLKCGAGYVLCVDVVGLASPKLYESWFGENPYSVEEFEEEPDVEQTMIPFGPYLAAGALAVVLFGPPLFAAVNRYFEDLGF